MNVFISVADEMKRTMTNILNKQGDMMEAIAIREVLKQDAQKYDQEAAANAEVDNQENLLS